MSEDLHRGDVVLLSFPFPTDPSRAKTRPAVIVQNDVGNRFSPNLIVAAISSRLPARRYPTNLILGHASEQAAGAGLLRDSVVQTEIIMTVPKASVVKRIGHLGEAAMRAIEQCLRVSLGLD